MSNNILPFCGSYADSSEIVELSDLYPHRGVDLPRLLFVRCDSGTSSQACTPLCSPERETETLTIGFSDMMCDVGNAAIKDAIANIARNREVLHFLSCSARFLGHFSCLPTIRPSGKSPTGNQ